MSLFKITRVRERDLENWLIFFVQVKAGGCCGSVGRAVASHTKGMQFKSSHQEDSIQNMPLLLTVEKTKIKNKVAVNAPFLKTTIFTHEFAIAVIRCKPIGQLESSSAR